MRDMKNASVLRVYDSSQLRDVLVLPSNCHLDPAKDVFELIHDLAYDHEGRARFQYRARAQKILATRGTSVQK